MGDPGTERGSFEDFFRRRHQEFARLAFTLTGSWEDAEDICGAALASAWEHWDRVQAADSPMAYVRRIIVNMSADQVRRTARERQGRVLLAPMTRWFYHVPDVGAEVDLHAAILMLPTGQRACVVLRHVFDLSSEDVSRTLGISQGTVKSQTSKGLAQLRKVLTDPREAGRDE